MPRLVTKFKYLKPNARQSRGGYVKYIATRDGVEKLDDSRKFAPATAKQRKLIASLLHDFPDSREMLEYWVNFMKTGKPADAEEWRPCTRADAFVKVLE